MFGDHFLENRPGLVQLLFFRLVFRSRRLGSRLALQGAIQNGDRLGQSLLSPALLASLDHHESDDQRNQRDPCNSCPEGGPAMGLYVAVCRSDVIDEPVVLNLMSGCSIHCSSLLLRFWVLGFGFWVL